MHFALEPVENAKNRKREICKVPDLKEIQINNNENEMLVDSFKDYACWARD